MKTKGQPSELGALAFAALGIVFGDIGTSPVIAIKQALVVVNYNASPAFLMGVVSMIFWALMLVVSIKYLVFITRADNQGEGGIFALLALLRASPTGSVDLLHIALILALIAAGLLFADSLLTPALSIVAAMEGLESVTENVSHWIIGGSICIVIGLFTIQQFGTGHIGRYFGAVMALWFIVISGLGVRQIIETPYVLEAIHPGHALGLILDLGPIKTIGVLGAVLLAVTGAEAIYADMGHFGRKPISIAWFSIAFTALTLNYLGQIAWMIKHPPDAGASPFFDIVPSSYMIPMVILTTLAGIIASQAVISGTFSLARQAINMNFLPRLKVTQTSTKIRHQIYIPKINLILAIGTILLILTFQSSTAMASAYGFAVAATMVLTTISFSLVGFHIWHWRLWKLGAFLVVTLPIDLAFLSASAVKIPSGGYITAAISVAAFLLMWAWIKGNEHLSMQASRIEMDLELLKDSLESRSDLVTISQPAIYFENQRDDRTKFAPVSLLRQIQLTHTLYEPAFIVHFEPHPVAFVQEEDKISHSMITKGIHRLVISYGFSETPSIAPLIRWGIDSGYWENSKNLVFFSIQESIRRGRHDRMAAHIRYPFTFLHHHDETLTRVIGLPGMQFVELGMPIYL